jgi:hypothetical protein
VPSAPAVARRPGRRASRKNSAPIFPLRVDAATEAMPAGTIQRRLQDCEAALASDDGPVFSTVAQLVDALKRSIPEGTDDAQRKKEAPAARK